MLFRSHLTSANINLMPLRALGGQESEATVLFSDIRGFTTLTESLGAQGTVSMLNAYFSLMVDCLQREGGAASSTNSSAMP